MNSRAIPISDFIAGKWDLPQPTQTPGTDNWDAEIAEIEDWLKNAILPLDPVKLNEWTVVTDARLFVDSHLEFVKAHNSNETYLPYLNRLQEFINQLNTK